jgi:antitoxin CptB
VRQPARRGDCPFCKGFSMTGTSVSSADLEPRRRRILFRAWHRGTREMDLLMGRFTDAEIAGMSEDDLTVFEALIEVPDRDLFSWITGTAETPDNYDTGVFKRLKAFHTHGKPIHV